MTRKIKILSGATCFVASLVTIMFISNDFTAYVSTSLLLALSISLFGDAMIKKR